MPPHLTTLVEGEGLLNDATALTAYQVAVAAAVGQGLSAAHAAGTFVLEALGGLVIGMAIAGLVRIARRWTDDPLVDNGISLGVRSRATSRRRRCTPRGCSRSSSPG
jgi:CPA1 family monovalent cation:H+ antiporter